MDEIDEEAWDLAAKRQRIYRREIERYKSLGFLGKVAWRMVNDLDTFKRNADGGILHGARLIAADRGYRLRLRLSADPAHYSS